MKAANSWTTYRTRFLVKAKQLNTALTFTDALGRQHSGTKGDYLVESAEGVLRIASRQIFEDIYVPLAQDELSVQNRATGKSDIYERREIPSLREPQPIHAALPPHLARKSPQPCHDRRAADPGLRSL